MYEYFMRFHLLNAIALKIKKAYNTNNLQHKIKNGANTRDTLRSETTRTNHQLNNDRPAKPPKRYLMLGGG